MMKERPITIFETKDEIGYANKKLWARIQDSKQCLRVLFTRATTEIMDGIDEKNITDTHGCANMLRDILDKNPFTSYMN